MTASPVYSHIRDTNTSANLFLHLWEAVKGFVSISHVETASENIQKQLKEKSFTPGIVYTDSASDQKTPETKEPVNKVLTFDQLVAAHHSADIDEQQQQHKKNTGIMLHGTNEQKKEVSLVEMFDFATKGKEQIQFESYQ